MTSDATTFFLAFTAVFAGIAALLWHLERRAGHLEDRLRALEADSEQDRPGGGREQGGTVPAEGRRPGDDPVPGERATANPKSRDDERGDQP